ncbi:hypothetical protein GCM10011415_11840 [Salipiger pallidus]|uniref:Uncharacterized protein n=1 Tax=Salipiger pallidus TaxID=1775170 RepID=A0A8J2ZID9_9RHOB|nr:polyketide synthase [Salipiger pallidus]GGG66647.1 hypothetical protein GCM10011415_11840 [Salipiger pallidus]
MRVLIRISPLGALVALLFVALATSGFAHRIVSADEQAAIAYTQAFGVDASEICGDPGAGSGGKGCEACRLHSFTSLPQPAVGLILAELSLDPVEWVSQPPILHDLAAVIPRHARAPPTV